MKRQYKSAIIKSLEYIKDRSKGLPVGIPIRTKDAKRLQELALADPAPCGYLHLIRKPVWSMRLTSAGETHLKIYQDGLKQHAQRES